MLSQLSDKNKIILAHYGIEHQKSKLIEELAELIVSTAKNDEQGMICEMADCIVMIDQIIKYYGCYERVLNFANGKIKRQIERIAKENDNN